MSSNSKNPPNSPYPGWGQAFELTNCGASGGPESLFFLFTFEDFDDLGALWIVSSPGGCEGLGWPLWGRCRGCHLPILLPLAGLFLRENGGARGVAVGSFLLGQAGSSKAAQPGFSCLVFYAGIKAPCWVLAAPEGSE